MKKLIAVLLALVLTMGASAYAAFDPTDALERPELFCVEESEDRDVTFIDTSNYLDAADLAFSFEGESDEYWSYMLNDLVLIDYPGDDAYPVWRLWIYRYTKEADPVDSVTFTFEGKNYTFTGLKDEEDISVLENGDNKQAIRIKFGKGNVPFLIDLENYYEKLIEGAESEFEAVIENADIKMTIHGKEDQTVEVSKAFLLDFMLIDSLFRNGDSAAYIEKVIEPSALSVSSVQ